MHNQLLNTTSPTKEFEPIEFSNNQWYRLFKHDISSTHLGTHANTAIPITNQFSLRYWDVTEPQHPDYIPGTQTAITIDPSENNNSTQPNTPIIQVTPATTLPSPTPGLTIAATGTTHTHKPLAPSLPTNQLTCQ